MSDDTSDLPSDQLLSYHEQFHVVICKSCHFAIQPSALPSHLLRHRIYRNERRQMLQKFGKLKLLEPEEVPLPSTSIDPLPDLSVHRGFKCLSTACDHACVSSKRMSQHWSEQHNEHDSRNVQARAAYLQTFFRGNKISYFEVKGPGNGCGPRGRANKTSNRAPAITSSSATPEPQPDDVFVPGETTKVVLDMQALQYFHHYIMTTSLSLRRDQAESELFWKVEIPQRAFKYPFLMFAILGLSALHQAVQSADSPATCQAHREAAIQFQNSSLDDFHSAIRLPDTENSTALIAFGRYFGVQRCVQDQLEWLHPIPPSEDEPHDNGLSKLLEFFFLLRGCHEMLFTLQHLLPPGSDLILSPQALESLSEMDVRRAVTPEEMSKIPTKALARIKALPAKLAPLLAAQEVPEAGLGDLEPAANALLAAFARSYSSSDQARQWDGVEVWLRTLPDQYIHMLSAGQPGALVIFAHWCCLVRRLEPHHWFCKGQALRLHSIAMMNLPNEEWMVLVKDMF